jgi:deoxyribodipyrimidine photo-lyase
VERYAPGGAAPGSSVDRPYAELERIARSAERIGPERGAPERGVVLPRLLDRPPESLGPPLPDVAGRDVVLVHPWALGPRAPGVLAIGILHAPFHASMPWSVERWMFVLRRMRSVTDALWMGEVQTLLAGLAAARSIRAVETMNAGYRDALRDPRVALAPVPRYFEEPVELCASFSQFWKAVAPDAAMPAEPA